ncbi:MAG: hypothetical protein DHS80DRAFT_22881 [Piptocephalis tieghemiana]|nr:MAG: hypothetical protein DHS80DRAFT_22881 [Piptocephalis tieghemiana]
MKLLTKAESDAAYDQALEGGAYGAALGVGLGSVIFIGLHRFSPGFRGLPIPFKAFLFSSGVTATTIINAEQRMTKFERRMYGESLLEEEEEKNRVLQEMRAKGSFLERARYFLEDNKWQAVGGVWLGGMGASMAYLASQKYLSFGQKLVQARMYAQLVTIVALLGTAGLSISHGRRNQVEALKVPAPSPVSSPASSPSSNPANSKEKAVENLIAAKIRNEENSGTDQVRMAHQ